MMGIPDSHVSRGNLTFHVFYPLHFHFTFNTPNRQAYCLTCLSYFVDCSAIIVQVDSLDYISPLSYHVFHTIVRH